MANTKELVSNPKLKILLVSPSGGGKTTLIASFVEAGLRGYIYDFDGRMEPLNGLDCEYDFYPADDPTSYDRAFDHLTDLQKVASLPYDFVAMEGYTSFTQAAMVKTMPLTKAFMPNMRRIADPKGRFEVPGGTDGADYNAAIAAIDKFTIKLAALQQRCHVIASVHELDVTNEEGALVGRTFAVSGRIPKNRIPGFFNEIWRPYMDRTAINGKPTCIPRMQTVRDNLSTPLRTAYGFGTAIGNQTIDGGLAPVEDPKFNTFYPKILDYLQKKQAAVAKMLKES